MKARAIITTKMSDEPKIVVTNSGAKVELELYEISVDELKMFVGKELNLTIEEVE